VDVGESVRESAWVYGTLRYKRSHRYTQAHIHVYHRALGQHLAQIILKVAYYRRSFTYLLGKQQKQHTQQRRWRRRRLRVGFSAVFRCVCFFHIYVYTMFVNW